MNYFSKTRVFQVTTILLVVMNIAVISTFWIRQKNSPNHLHSPKHKPNIGHYLENELQLTDKQKNSYRTMREAHFRSVRKELETIRSLKEQLFDGLKQTKAADSLSKSIAIKIGHHQTNIEMLTFNHFQRVRSICDSAQQNVFDGIIQEVLRSFGKPPGPPHPKRHP